MTRTALSVGTLLLAIFMIMAGSGFLATLISLRLEAAGLPAVLIGLVATAYFAGLTIGSVFAFKVVAQVGHIRAFAAFVSLYSATSLSYAIQLDPVFWSLLRLTDGFCMAGVFVCLESWLNERAESETRGSILAFYMIALYSGQAVGQFLLNLGHTWPSMPFIAASILLSLAVLPIALTRLVAPAPPEGRLMPLKQLFGTSPLGAVGVATTGLMLGAFYGLGAVFARGMGLSDSDTALFMSATILGGVALQWPLGRLSDIIDRRTVIVAGFVVTAGISLLTALTVTHWYTMMLAGAWFGGVSFALYPLCVAHTNDHLRSGQRVGATGALVLLYSLGAAAGPLPAAALMDACGPQGLFLFICLCAVIMLVFALIRVWLSPPVPGERQRPYLLLPRTTPVAAQLDPLSPEN